MPTPRLYGRTGNASFRPADTPSRINVECPRCKALPGTRCFKLSSWVSTGPKGEGFHTAHNATFHNERRSPRSPQPVHDSKALRGLIAKLSQRKLGGHGRMDVRRWAGSTRRTPEELAAKVAELEALPDLN